MATRKVFAKKNSRIFPREMVRIRTSGNLNPTASRSGQTITTVPARKVLVIETISANIRIPKATPTPEVARFVVVTGSAFPSGTGSPLLEYSHDQDGDRSCREFCQLCRPGKHQSLCNRRNSTVLNRFKHSQQWIL